MALRERMLIAVGMVAVCCALLAAAAAAESTGVLTAGYNNLRDGWDPAEPGLSPATVSSASFGQLFSTKLSGAVYAQPLLVDGTLVATTEKANAYGIDPVTGAVRWTRNFGKAFKANTIGCGDLKPDLGSTSTPVVDPAAGIVYLTTRLQVGKGVAGSHWYLQAISASTGQEQPGFPVEIKGTPANTPGIPFDEGYAMQRPGLLLLNGVVYIAFASNCDIAPYRGIVVGFNAASGALTSAWSDEAGPGADENSEAGIWQSGGGLVSDIPGRIVLSTGNGLSPQPAPSGSPPETLSESVVGLTIGAGGAITPTQFFAPSDAPSLDAADQDLGSGGPVALPREYFGTVAHPHLIVQVGKDGRVFLIDADNMGGYRQGPSGGDAVLQTLGPFNGVWGHTAVYGGQGGWVYELESAGGGFLRALQYGLSGEGVPQLSSVATSTESFGYTSGSPTVTSKGTEAGSGIVWVVWARDSSAESGAGGQLRAYAATPSEGTLPLLWSGKIGKASKFAVPTAYQGRVYVGTRNGRLVAFGASGGAAVAATPLAAGSVPVGTARTFSLPVIASQALKLTAPVRASGVEAAPTPEVAPVTVKGTTAGPKKSPWSGTAELARGVLTVEQPPVGTAVSAGGTLPLRVRFKPARPGPVVAELTVSTSRGERTIAFSGYGSAPGLLATRNFDFGTLETGAGGKFEGVTIANSWNEPEQITSISTPRAPWSVSGLPARGTVLAPHQSLTVSVRLDPSAPGNYRDALRVGTAQGSATITLSGAAATGQARLTAPAHLNAGTVTVGATRTVTLPVANSGNIPLTITRAIAPFGAFSVVSALPEGVSLSAGAIVHLRIRFHPSTRGLLSARYVLNSDDGRGQQIVTITGRGA